MSREVTERDFRMPEYRDAKPEDYEFRGDGRLVRKDRWETAVNTIRSLMGISARSFEIEDVVTAVETMVAAQKGWEPLETDQGRVFGLFKDNLAADALEVLLDDGSCLTPVTYSESTRQFMWRGAAIAHPITAWRQRQ